ncbi:PepSY domain-containing protein [Rhizobium daejeonense]|uniref:PepSY domain-containing protein n=1 Tax=Rhizobium daejeonense TaxID=240521 RepID=A0A6M1S6Q5_9HYPH|nr:PepSY domain-containing protein [Rhizobium daejeonense]NGO65991.1 PepSY domain-containing protein [Rhizobium daejeonense]
MNRLLLALTFAGACSIAAFAQTTTTPPANDGETPAVATPDGNNPTAPVEGANSFTEEQVKQRLTDAGFVDITGLKLDDKGVWRASASKGGKAFMVALDYQGNIVTN